MTNATMVPSPKEAEDAGQVPNPDPTPLVPTPEGAPSVASHEDPVDSPGSRPDFNPLHEPGLRNKTSGE